MANRIREVPVAALPFEARVELLTALGIQATDEAAEVAEASAGVPYYLHLAREAGPAAGAFPRLEERFLHHVDPAMVRLLELLSVARLFDREIFVRLAVHFGMPSDAITWETLIGYSFVSSAGTDTLQLHQLMAQAIRARLSGPVRQELHGVLHEAWRDRASAADSAHAWREAAYHATRVTTPPAALLVDYADRMMALEGQAGLKALLADQPRQPRLHALWRAESALLVGDTAAALAETASVDRELPAQADDIDARLAIAAAHAYRIHGDTSEAQARYGEIWSTYQGTVALDAGTWYADLHMAQGRFIDAVAVAEEVASRCPADRHTVQGDVARLRFLAHRFAFDLDRAATHLHHAQECYSNSGHAVGLANIATNRVELLALTDPAAAIDAADAAISAQQRLSADHELGKVYTAVAVAHLGLGQREPAARALDQAVTVLDRCGYRSGRARAELVRALWHAQAGAPEPAQRSVAWAVAELQAAEVYPTLIMVAAELLAQLGRADPAVTSAGTRAGTRVQAPQGAAGLAEAIRNLVSRTIRVGWDDLYAAAQADDQVLSGFYHRNVRVGDHLVRAPITGAPQMDLQIWPEPAVLALAARHVPSAPTLRFASDAPPRYQVHDWIDGPILDVVAPRGTPVPAGVIPACASLFAQLAQVPADELPPLPEDWPADGDCAGFAARLLALTKSVYARFADEYGQLWNDLEIPADPFAALRFDQLSPRPFRLLHCDVHRKNILLQPTDDGPVYRFLDWELACFGDPVYDLAVHLHKMGYLPEEEDAACHGWQTACRTEQWPRWREDLRAYREHEWVKSAIVDSVRYAQLLATAPAQRKAQVGSLTAKLAAARRAWEQPSPVDPERVSAALLAAAGRRQGDR